MDKDVEVSKDQSTIVVDGARMMATPRCLESQTCNDCHVLSYVGDHSKCYVIPCASSDRRDGIDQIFICLL